MASIAHRELTGGPRFWGVLIALGALSAVGAGAALYMELLGHWVSGMNQHVVWGVPHVFAVFLIVAASGALNVASIGSVFGRTPYKPLGRMSGLLALTLLAAGLAVLVLDLGRPDRLIVAMTTYNFRSIFAWNIFLYTGFMAIVGVYLWFMMDRHLKAWSSHVGFLAFLWRLILTTGTGSIFGFLVSRVAFDAAILAPTFIAMSFAYGLAIFLLVLMVAMKAEDRPLGDYLLGRMARLLGVFQAAVLFFVATYHLTSIYAPESRAFEAWLLLDGGGYTALFWIGQILLGTLAPIALLLYPGTAGNRTNIAIASVLIVIGGICQMTVTIIASQAFPRPMFPGYEAQSSFLDGQVAPYSASAPEILLGLGGIGIFLLATTVGLRVLRFLPETLADSAVDPHHAPARTAEAAGEPAANPQAA